MMKFKLLLAIVAFSANALLAQNTRFEDEKEETPPATQEGINPTPLAPKPVPAKTSFWDRTRFGGNAGVQFGTFTFINISPRMYYLATEKWWVGTGLTFIYSKDNTNYGVPVPDEYREQFVYGLNFFTTYQLIGPVFVQAEYEPLNFERTYQTGPSEFFEERIWVNNLFLGGGLSQPMGRGAIFLSVLYNVTWSSTSDNMFYSSPWVFRIGAGF